MIVRALLKFEEEIDELYAEICNKIALQPEDQRETSSGVLGHQRSISLYKDL